MADEGVVVSNSPSSSNTDYTVAVDTVGGKEYQRVKLDAGADGAVQPIVAGQQVMSASLPVALASDQSPLDVAIVSGSSSNTEYTEGDTDASITGVAALMEVGSDTLQPIQGTVTDGLLVNLGANNDVTVAGVSTAAKQDTIIGHVDGIEGLLTTIDADTGALAACASGTELQVDIVSSALPTGAATSAKQDTIIGHLDGVEGLLTTIDADTSALAGAVSGSELQVDVVGALPAGTNNIGDVDVLTVPTDPFGANADAASATGSISAKLRFIASTGIPITGTVTVGSHAVTNAGTFAVQESGGALTALQIMDDWDNAASDGASVSGDVAHDAADAGEPVKVGFKAANALPTAVANNDRANGVSDLFGRQLVGHIDPAMQVVKAVNVTAQQTGSDVWSPGAGKKIAVTHLAVSSYGTTAGRVILWFGDNADTTYTAGTDQVLWAGSFAPSSTSKPGAVIPFPHPVFCTTADRELHLTTDAAISLDITVHGYEW